MKLHLVTSLLGIFSDVAFTSSTSISSSVLGKCIENDTVIESENFTGKWNGKMPRKKSRGKLLSGGHNMTKTGGLLLSVFIASYKYQAGRGASI